MIGKRHQHLLVASTVFIPTRDEICVRRFPSRNLDSRGTQKILRRPWGLRVVTVVPGFEEECAGDDVHRALDDPLQPC